MAAEVWPYVNQDLVDKERIISQKVGYCKQQVCLVKTSYY